jgi:hypothetical protein
MSLQTQRSSDSDWNLISRILLQLRNIKDSSRN